MSFILITKGRGVNSAESRMTNGILQKGGLFVIINTIKTFYREQITTTFSLAAKVDSVSKSTIAKTTRYLKKTLTFKRDKIQ